MTKEAKLGKAIRDFSALPEDKKDYILGILQAMVFACNEGKEKVETADSGAKHHAG
jgi:hypothetical protein